MESAIERERKIFEDALELSDPAEREAFLDGVCGSDPKRRARISKLIVAHAKADRFFTDCVTGLMISDDPQPLPGAQGADGVNARPDVAVEEQIGARIGNYRILEKIGEGGCGAVYLAEQERPIRRRVALKIIKLGMDTRAVISRFELERQALALMDHPNIARVLDGGATEAGRPYFVMELVRGVRITQYCDENNLDMRQRLRLFLQICHAIQHAHQKGIIHRDIKPSNILVTLNDGIAVPKVIDFGIAKATGAIFTEHTLFTTYGHFVGTPVYMSPEQAGMSGLDVDTRSDVYSLGVLLYELLTGTTPFDQKELLGSGLDQMRRTLQEKDPHRPSTKLDTLRGEELTETALRRCTEPPKLRSQLSGDLDWVVMKALEKDRTRRYETANGLAMDIERHLDNEPVVARPPSGLYRFQKLVRRNQATFAAGLAVLAALVIGLGVSTWLFLREREARQRAVAAEHRADRLREEAENRQKLTQATFLLSRDKMEEADQLIGGIPVSEASLEYAGVFRSLGDWHAVHTRWQQASDRFATLVQMGQPDDWDATTLDYLRQGPVLLAVGDPARYEAFRRLAIAHFATTANPLPAERVVKVSLLRPADSELLRSLQPLAQLAAKSLDRGSPGVEPSLAAWRSFSLALMEYRLGNYAGAVAWCERSLAYQSSNLSRRVNVNLVLAMSHFRLGQTDRARTEFNESRGLVEGRFRSGLQVGDGASGFWFDWLFAQVLLPEAAGMIRD